MLEMEDSMTNLISDLRMLTFKSREGQQLGNLTHEHVITN